MNEPRKQRILFIQDAATTQQLSCVLRERGYEVICRETGAAGFDYLRQHPVHLVILETQLPDRSGFDCCQQIRRAGFQQPILVLTHQDTELDKVLALEMGADDYVTKPFGLREVVSRIRALLRRSYGELSRTAAEPLIVGDLQVDPCRGQVWRCGAVVRLTPTEFRLLVYLMANANQVCTRSQILDAIWGYDTNIEGEQVVNTYICRLREKIEPDRAQPTLIQTINGVGYYLERPL